MIPASEACRHAQETGNMPQSIRPPEMPSGVPAMDRLHQDFFASLNRLMTTPDREFCAGYRNFVAQVEDMFCQEEQWMEEIDFPMSRMHREQHARALAALHNVHSRVMDGDFRAGREVTGQLLSQWLSFHMSTLDAALALAMQVADAQRVPSPASRRRSETIPTVP